MSVSLDDNFNGIAIRVLRAGYNDARAGATSIEHVPFGNYNILQVAGRKERTLDFRAYVPDDGTRDALEAQVATEATDGNLTITLQGGNSNVYTATLTSVSTEQEINGGGKILKLSFVLDAD